MQKMGYVVGTGLGPRADGRIEPVTAVILPAGKSLGKHHFVVNLSHTTLFYFKITAWI